MKIYAISGLGADKRVFQYLKLNHELIAIDWIIPIKNEDITQYSERLSSVIKTSEDFVILGVSFGGLVAVEMSKVLNPKMTILISSVEINSQLPKIFGWLGKGILKYLPEQFFDIPRKFAGTLFGTTKTKLLNQILDDTDLSFAKWAVNELVNWKNKERLENALKISGTKDRLLPASGGENEVLIEGGAHFMIVDRADEISDLINEKLR